MRLGSDLGEGGILNYHKEVLLMLADKGRKSDGVRCYLM